MGSAKDSALAFTLKGGKAISGSGAPAGISQDEARVEMLMRGDEGLVMQRDKSDEGWGASLDDQLKNFKPARGSIGALNDLQHSDQDELEGSGEEEMIDEEEFGDEQALLDGTQTGEFNIINIKTKDKFYQVQKLRSRLKQGPSLGKDDDDEAASEQKAISVSTVSENLEEPPQLGEHNFAKGEQVVE